MANDFASILACAEPLVAVINHVAVAADLNLKHNQSP
jgi:hypothetical protein